MIARRARVVRAPRRRLLTRSLSLFLAWGLPGVLAAAQETARETTRETIGSVPYQRLATRAATLERMLGLLQPQPARFGSWHLLSPFPFEGHGQGDLATVQAPEAELARMVAGGPGPDLTATYVGKKDVAVAWRELGRVYDERIDLHVHEDAELNDLARCFLYARVDSERAVRVEVTCGSDDGMRLWLNGALLVDKDVPRGLNPEDEQLVLDLETGPNHLFVEIVEGFGGWDFQMNVSKPLPYDVDAHLQYALDRDFPRTPEREHYRALTVPVPDDIVLEVGGLDFLSDGTPVVATRRGDVFFVRDAYADPPLEASFERFASGLHEPLGIGVRREAAGEAIYTVQRGELTRLVDEDGDGRADLYEAVTNGWGISGNYHEFAFGPEFDDEGNAWVSLNVGFCGGLGKSTTPWRGWALKVTPAGEIVPVCDGMRSPNGIGFYEPGVVFYVDNQGDYVGTNRLSVLTPGAWHGHPASLRWRDDLERPDARPPRQPASVWFPYGKMGQSAADVAVDRTQGAFGPFEGQLFIGDQTRALVMRAFVEEVEGHWQGACFPFLAELDCGVNRVAFAPDGSMFVGETDRGWASTGRKTNGLEHIVYTGVLPFEIRTMRATEDGFELVFTQAVEPGSALAADSYTLSSYTYEYHAAYGSPEIDERSLTIASLELTAPDTVRMRVEGLREGYVHELEARGVRSAGEGRALLHPEAYYTLIRIPGRSYAAAESADDLPRVLFLTHSAGFVHDVVKRPDPFVLSHAEERLVEAARGRFRVEATQDCGRITKETLADTDAVVFYTTGELPIPDEGRRALLDWMNAGGAFVGIHSATDTLYEYPPYVDLIGGLFDGHPWHTQVGVRVTDGSHPALRGLPPSFELTDEIYQFKDLQAEPLRTLLDLEPTSVDLGLGNRTDGRYPLAWWKDYGEGRLFYTALGHRREVWEDERFLSLVLEGLGWALRGPDVPAPAPKGAVELFSRGLEDWRGPDGEPATWRGLDGVYLPGEVGEELVSAAEFLGGRFHIEFQDDPEATEPTVMFLNGSYALTLGTAGASEESPASLAGRPPAVSAARPAGRWQSLDVTLAPPGISASGRKTLNARISVWLNGRLVHDAVELEGASPGAPFQEAIGGRLVFRPASPRVRLRNVWVLPI